MGGPPRRRMGPRRILSNRRQRSDCCCCIDRLLQYRYGTSCLVPTSFGTDCCTYSWCLLPPPTVQYTSTTVGVMYHYTSGRLDNKRPDRSSVHTYVVPHNVAPGIIRCPSHNTLLLYSTQRAPKNLRRGYNSTLELGSYVLLGLNKCLGL